MPKKWLAYVGDQGLECFRTGCRDEARYMYHVDRISMALCEDCAVAVCEIDPDPRPLIGRPRRRSRARAMQYA